MKIKANKPDWLEIDGLSIRVAKGSNFGSGDLVLRAIEKSVFINSAEFFFITGFLIKLGK